MEKIIFQVDVKNFFERLAKFRYQPKKEDIGYIQELGDGIARISGLADVRYNEIILFKNGVLGLALNLEKNNIGAIILGDFKDLKEGDEVYSTGRLLEIPVGENILGRVLDPLGRPLDEGEPIRASNFLPLEKIAPQVVERQPVNRPLQTGITAIDAMIPIGRGQRELIIGDRGTGKTAIALDTIINQKPTNKDQRPVICIYVGIGQKASKISQVIETLKKYGSLKHTVVITANASDSVALQYLAPYAGCAVGEYFMQKGMDAAVFYDDLTKHAWAYRQLSLLLRRPSGREAYPGDIFYLHSRLLERSCRLADRLGGGSLTGIPIIETQAGDFSSYIPTNIISITDGQIYLEPDLFYAGIRPALNVGLSVSRVGGSAQVKIMKQVAGRLRLDLAQYRELAAFTQFGTELEESTKKILDRGARITEVFKQPQYQPVPVAEQVAIIWVVVNGYVDDLDVKEVKKFQNEFLLYLKEEKTVLKMIDKEKKMTPQIEQRLNKTINKFKEKFLDKYHGEPEKNQKKD